MVMAEQSAPHPSTGGSPSIVVSLLGPFAMTIDGQPVTSFRSNKARALLAYLLLASHQAAPRSDLIALLWSDYTAESAQANLRQTLSNLRIIGEPFDLLQSDRQAARLQAAATTVWCDALAFTALLDACDQHPHSKLATCVPCQERLKQAVALYRGDLLEKFPPLDSPPFNEWLQRQRAYFAERLAQAQAALAGEVAPVGNLVRPLTSLVGRSQEQDAVIQRLGHAFCRCVSIVGPGGIGKTRLAQAVGEQMQPHFADGVWLVKLGGLAPTTPDEPASQVAERLATTIAAALGQPFSGARPPTEQVAAYLAAKESLLILDSFEHLMAGAAWLPTLLTAAPRLRLLVTTRHRLPLQSQLVYPLQGLSVPSPEVANTASATHLLAQYAGLQLFIQRAAEAGLPLPLDGATLAAVGQLCQFVEGSPWAIEVAVALLDRQSPAAILAAIQQNYRALTTPLLDVPLRQRSAEAVFLTTWRLLSPSEAQTVARCAVFRGGFTLDAAQTVAGASQTTLEALLQKSLLRTDSAGRYTMHDLARQFAEEQLAQEAAGDYPFRLAHATYFTGLLATWQPEEAAEQRFRTAVTQEWDNVQAAWAWAVAHDQVALLQAAVGGLAEYYEMMGLYQEAAQRFGTAAAQVRRRLASDPDGGPGTALNVTARQRLLAHLLWRQSSFLINVLGQLTAAVALVDEVVAWGERLAEPTLTAWGYYEAGMIAYFQGAYERQDELLQRALPLAHAQGDRYQQAYCRHMLGNNLRMQNQYATAQQELAAALTLAETLGASRLALLIGNNLAACYWDGGQLLHALTTLEHALVQAQQMAQPDSAAFATLALGGVAMTLGDYANARRYLERAYQAYVTLGDHLLGAHTLVFTADLLRETGELTLAAAYCQRTLESPASQTFDVRHELLPVQGNLYRQMGNWSAARTAYTEAYALETPNNLPVRLLPLQSYLAAVDLAEGAVAAAHAAIEPLLTHFATTPFLPMQRPQELLLIAYQILVANGDPRASAVLQQAWAYVQEEAAKIDDPRLRDTFLTNVSVNRELARLASLAAPTAHA